MQSLVGSSTGSLCHGVSLYELLEAHIAPHPLSLMQSPAAGLPMTLTHGAGGRVSPAIRISYSFRSLYPPIPLKYRRPSPETLMFSRTSSAIGALTDAVDLTGVVIGTLAADGGVAETRAVGANRADTGRLGR